MDKEDIICMAREANLMSVKFSTALEEMWVGQLERFANLVAAAENEACAKVCENMCGPIEIYNPAYVHYVGCAEAIRARGQHD